MHLPISAADEIESFTRYMPHSRLSSVRETPLSRNPHIFTETASSAMPWQLFITSHSCYSYVPSFKHPLFQAEVMRCPGKEQRLLPCTCPSTARGTGSIRVAVCWGWLSTIAVCLDPGTHLRAARRGWVHRRLSKPRGALLSSPHWRRASQQSRSPDRKPVPSCPPRRLWCFPRLQTLLVEPWPKNRFGKPSRGTRTSAEYQG